MKMKAREVFLLLFLYVVILAIWCLETGAVLSVLWGRFVAPVLGLPPYFGRAGVRHCVGCRMSNAKFQRGREKGSLRNL